MDQQIRKSSGLQKEVEVKTGLSAVKYIKNNKRTCAVLLVALSLTFMAMYIVNYLLMTTEESFKVVMLELPKKVSYADLSASTLGVVPSEYEDDEALHEAMNEARENFAEKLEEEPGVGNVVYTQIINSVYEGIIGQIYYECPLLSKEDIPGYLSHMGAELVDGRMPENDGDILVDSVVMKNQGYVLGGPFMENAYGETFKVCGVIKSDYMACVGLPNGFTNSGWYFVVPHDEDNADFEKLAKKAGITTSGKDDIIDIGTYRKFYDTEVIETIDKAVNMIILVIIIFLTVSVIVAYVSFMRNRLNEYCLYASLGYAKKEIYGMIMREMLIIFAAGVFIGMLLSLGLMAVFDAGAIEPKGLVSKWFYPGHLLKIGTALCCIVGILQLPILVSIHSIKTIDMMED